MRLTVKHAKEDQAEVNGPEFVEGLEPQTAELS